MEKVGNTEAALRFVKHYGYLNAFETPADSWYAATDTPMEQDGDNGRLIGDEAAETLIEEGKVVEVSRGHPPNDGSTRVVCYRAA